MNRLMAIFCMACSLLVACNLLPEKEEAVAKIGLHTLTMDELKKSIPDYLDATDSAIWADDYIKKWVQQQLLLMKAEESLTTDLKDVSQELEEYRNSLIIYRYKNELMKQKLDTTVKEADIQKYFSQNRESFILNRNILKAIYIKIPVNLANPDDIKDLCISENPEKIARLNEYCLSYAKAYDRFNDRWVSADMVFKYIPKEITNQEQLIENNRFIESKDIDFYYLVCIRDYRKAGQVAPLEYVYSDIVNLILSKQKLQFLKQIEKDIYNEGLDNKKVKLYKIKNTPL